MSKLLTPAKKIREGSWTFLLLFFTYLMGKIISPYTSWQWDVDFLWTKQHLAHLNYYRISFYAHIFSSLLVLGCGAFLFSNYILKKQTRLHSFLGKIYVALLLLISAPSGLIMAFHANGGWLAQLSFILLTPLWWWFTWKGYQTARQKKFKAHKRWMIRSYALTLSAISLRILQLTIGAFYVIDPVLQYTLVSWLSWIGNLLIAEWLIGTKIHMNTFRKIRPFKVSP